MDKYITRSLKIVSRECIVDEHSFKHAVKELNKRADELINLSKEIKSKGLLFKDVDLELSNEMTDILLTLTLYLD